MATSRAARRSATRNGKVAASTTADDEASRRPSTKTNTAGNRSKPGRFTMFAQNAAQWTGRPSAFVLATAIIVVWGVTGPLFGFSDTWQLVINTGTTIVTFLMVFLIQHTQNRDALAFHLKLDELIIKLHGAGNELAAAEDLCDEDLEALHEEYRRRATHAQGLLHKRRSHH